MNKISYAQAKKSWDNIVLSRDNWDEQELHDFGVLMTFLEQQRLEIEKDNKDKEKL